MRRCGERQGSWALRAVLLLVGAGAGCSAAPAPPLGLARDRYVLPAEPAPPPPRSEAEQRELESQWPAVPLPIRAPMLRAAARPAWRPRLRAAHRSTATVPPPGRLPKAPRAQGLRPVIVRVEPSPHEAAPRVEIVEPPN